MEELADSAHLIGDASALRQRFAESGYLFLRGVLDVDAVTHAGAAVVASLTAGAWLDRSGAPSVVPRALDTRDALHDPAFREAISARPVNRIPYLPRLRAVLRGLLGPQAFSYPVKILRAVYPDAPAAIARGRYVHQDFAVAGVSDMITTWVPFMTIPVDLGGLAVLPGSHRDRPRPPRPLRGNEPGWATTHYKPGDVVLFHCLTSHAALPNRGTQLRISQDSRWQPIEQLAPAELIYGPRRRGIELFSTQLRHESWWEPVPATATIATRDQRPSTSPSSRLFPVHHAWSTWQPPPRPVH